MTRALSIAQLSPTEEAIEKILNGEVVHDEELIKRAVSSLLVKVNSKKCKQFSQIVLADPSYRKYILENYNKLKFLKKYPSFQMTKDEREIFIQNLDDSEACELLIDGNYQSHERSILIDKIFIRDWNETLIRKFFLKAKYTQADVDRAYERSKVKRTPESQTTDKEVSFLFGSQPNDPRRKEIFDNLIKRRSLYSLMDLINKDRATENERKQIIDELGQRTGVRILKYYNSFPKLFKNREEQSNFVTKHRRKIIEAALTQDAKGVLKELGLLTQKDVDLIIKILKKGDKYWELEPVKEILELVDQEIVQMRKEDYDVINAIRIMRLLG